MTNFKRILRITSKEPHPIDLAIYSASLRTFWILRSPEEIDAIYEIKIAQYQQKLITLVFQSNTDHSAVFKSFKTS